MEDWTLCQCQSKGISQIFEVLESFPGRKIITFYVMRPPKPYGINHLAHGDFDMEDTNITTISKTKLRKIFKGPRARISIVVRQFLDEKHESGIPWKNVYGFHFVRGNMYRLSAECNKVAQCTDPETGAVLPEETAVHYC
mmetsp:Transcript_11647/g.15838  ORF Transcript_11647/g.15838 Transcript_11647/m.15838 type:complete len:140 (+) Transcript_11647:564-983(+)